jgi:hypothetical protein
MTPKSLLLCIFVAICAVAACADAPALRGKESEASDNIHRDDEQSHRKLPPGQPNYGLTKAEHQRIYGWVDEAGWYGQYGYYDGGEYERGRYGDPWGDGDFYRTRPELDNYSRPARREPEPEPEPEPLRSPGRGRWNNGHRPGFFEEEEEEEEDDDWTPSGCGDRGGPRGCWIRGPRGGWRWQPRRQSYYSYYDYYGR